MLLFQYLWFLARRTLSSMGVSRRSRRYITSWERKLQIFGHIPYTDEGKQLSDDLNESHTQSRSIQPLLITLVVKGSREDWHRFGIRTRESIRLWSYLLDQLRDNSSLKTEFYRYSCRSQYSRRWQRWWESYLKSLPQRPKNHRSSWREPGRCYEVVQDYQWAVSLTTLMDNAD